MSSLRPRVATSSPLAVLCLCSYTLSSHEFAVETRTSISAAPCVRVPLNGFHIHIFFATKAHTQSANPRKTKDNPILSVLSWNSHRPLGATSLVTSDRARLVQLIDLLQLFLRQHQLEPFDQLIQPLIAPSAHDGRSDPFRSARPGDGHLGHGHASLLGNLLDLVDDRFVRGLPGEWCRRVSCRVGQWIEWKRGRRVTTDQRLETDMARARRVDTHL